VNVLCKVRDRDGDIAGYLTDKSDTILTFETVCKMLEYDKTTNVKIVNDKLVSKQGKMPEQTALNVNKAYWEKTLKARIEIERDMRDDLLEWYNRPKEKQRLVYFLGGLRQLGKTYELRRFAYTHYDYVIELNVMDKGIIQSFKDCVFGKYDFTLAFEMFCKRNGIAYKNTINTVIILDEIQHDADIFNTIRSFRNKLNCDVMVTGSYLGRIISKEFFQPMGDTWEYTMLPLSFPEFVRNVQKDNIDMQSVLKTLNKDAIDTLRAMYKLYTNIGGYPSVVREYKRTGDIMACEKAIDYNVNRFITESQMYLPADVTKLFPSVLNQVAIILSKGHRNVDYNLTDIVVAETQMSDTNLKQRRKHVNEALRWLYNAELILPANLNCNGDTTNIVGNTRFYLADMGILHYFLNVSNIATSTEQGIITENYVYLCMYPYCKNLFAAFVPCYATCNEYELDFQMGLRYLKTRYGFEVKSGNTKGLSLNYFLEHKLIDKAVKFTGTGYGGDDGRITTVPLELTNAYLDMLYGKVQDAKMRELQQIKHI